MAIDTLIDDVKHASYTFSIFIPNPSITPSDINLTKIRLDDVRAIRKNAVRLDDKVRAEGLVDAKEKNK